MYKIVKKIVIFINFLMKYILFLFSQYFSIFRPITLKFCKKNKQSLVVPSVKYFCPKGKFTCRDFSCISIVHRCDGHVDCPQDHSDEEGCRMFVFSNLSLYFEKAKT